MAAGGFGRRFAFQRIRETGFIDRVLRHYRTMHEAFFEQRPLIPNNQFCEVRFADLEREPIEQLGQIYRQLNLPDFRETRLAVEAYVATLRNYRKNEYPPLEDALRARIAREWADCFERWRYAV